MNRRDFLRRTATASALAPTCGLCARQFAPWPAVSAARIAQHAPDTEFGRPISRAELKQQLHKAFPFDDDAQSGGTITIGSTTDLTTVNHMLAGDPLTLTVLGLIQETLVRPSPLDATFVPRLADSWQISPDALTYAFYLNPNARWHDGAPLTSDDVTFSFDAQSDPAMRSPFGTRFNLVVDTYRPLDEHTVEITATEPYAPVVFLAAAYCPILPRHIWSEVTAADWPTASGSTGEDPARVIGSGPFKFESWNPGKQAKLIRNEDYYDDVPHIDAFVLKVLPEDASPADALQHGEIDVFENVAVTEVADLAAADRLDVAIYDTYDFTWYGYNLDPEKTTLFSQKEVRQALFYALNRTSMVEHIMRGFGRVAIGTQPVLSPAYAPAQVEHRYGYNPSTARQLLTDAGWSDDDGDGMIERDGEKLAFEIMYADGDETTARVAASMRDAWRASGVEATPRSVDFSAVLVPALTENFDFDVCLVGFTWDLTGDQSSLFATDQYRAGFNAMKYSNAEYDNLAKAADHELDPAQRRQLLIDATNIVTEDLPAGILWFRQDRTAYNARLRNFFPNGKGGLLWSLPDVWIDQS